MRTAFQAWLAYEHRSQASRISAVAVGGDGSKLYLGLTDGQLEEYNVTPGPQGVRLSLEARKHVGKQSIVGIDHVAASRRLAILCDGALVLLDDESLEGQALPGLKGVTAVAPRRSSGPSRGKDGHLAVALRSSKRSVRIMVFEVLPGADVAVSLGAAALCEAQAELAEPMAVKAMAWLGSDLIVCTALRAMLLDVTTATYTQIFALAPESPSTMLVQGIPDAQQALLLVDQAGIFVNRAGQPTGTALTFPTTPGAIAAAGMHVLAACTDAMHVYDRTSAVLVQSLPYLEGAQPTPGQRLLTSHDPRGSCICLAGLRKVWLYMPVALEEQVKQVLRAGEHEQALALASAGAANGAPWAETAFAEAGFLLLQELRWQQAIEALLQCSVTTFQPLELFPLFPEMTAPWAHLQPRKSYWNLHPPLTSLDALVQRNLQGHQQASANGAPSSLQRQAGVADAQGHVAEYLLQVRTREGVEALDGIDTLIAHLLAVLGSTTRLEALASSKNAARLEELIPVFQLHSQWPALALFKEARGKFKEAIHIWKDLADQRKQGPDASTSGRDAQATAALAISHVGNLLRDKHAIADHVVLRYLPWLLNAAPQHTSALLRARPLDMAEVLALLRQVSTTALQDYLSFLVLDLHTQDPALATEFILLLADAALALMPLPDLSLPSWERARLRRSLSRDDPALTKQQEAREKLLAALHDAQQWDPAAVLQRLQGSELWEECVAVHQKRGDHDAALRILALDLGDIRGAERYCAQQAGPQGRLALLRMLLAPGHGRSPLYAEACHLLAAQGGDLDPLEVLHALGEGVPLAVAVPTLERMLRERIHRARQGTVLKHLHRACHLSAASERAELLTRRVTATEERACRLCHARLGTQVFAAYPNGVLVCFRCFRHSKPTVCPVTGTNFAAAYQDPLAAPEKWPD